MEQVDKTMYVFLPCGENRCWVVPQNCLAEIVTLQAEHESPPNSIQWRGHTVPVIDYGVQQLGSWRDNFGTGFIAVMLGLEGSELPVWGVLLRPCAKLTSRRLADEDFQEVQESDEALTFATFSYQDERYEVPHLENIQRTLQADN